MEFSYKPPSFFVFSASVSFVSVDDVRDERVVGADKVLRREAQLEVHLAAAHPELWEARDAAAARMSASRTRPAEPVP